MEATGLFVPWGRRDLRLPGGETSGKCRLSPLRGGRNWGPPA